jgi:signal transduction histidine kinase
MGFRIRSIRQKILLLVLVPVLSLIGLYIFATSITARNAINLGRSDTLKNATGLPTGSFLAAIDAERPLVMVYLSRPSGANLAALELVETKTNNAAAALRTALNSGSTMGNASTPEKQAIATLLTDVAGLPSLRAQVRSQIITRPQAFNDYNNVVEDSYNVLNQVILQETTAGVVTQGLALVRMAKSQDMLLREGAIVLADMAAGSFPPSDRQDFTQLVGARRTLSSQTLADLQPSYRGYYTRDVSPQASTALATLESTLINDTAAARPPTVSPLAWQQSVGGVAAGMSRAGTQAANQITARANAQSRSTYLTLLLAGGLGLLAVALSIIVSIWIGRGLVRELAALRQSALELAHKRLPDVVQRLAAGQDVDVAAEAPELPASSDEIGQVRQAFAAVQQTAVEAAVGQARLRRGISDIFRNLARRSQSLLHRQLALLDAMERRAKEPGELEDLFRIDHLTTRMRRHAESLIILSGDAPARGWRHPVPFVDVLRAAVAEVEDYTRIRVTSTTRAAISGPAVADVIHLIAELAENAVIFSPPNTPVQISGDIVGRGFAVEIEDRGLGLSEERRTELNGLLENPPPFDLSGSDQLGLFVASQLAHKHNIRISLRSSPYGGTTAIVLIPVNLVVSEESYDESLADQSGPRPVQLSGRHAAREDTGSFGPAPAVSTAAAADQPTGAAAASGWAAEAADDPWTSGTGNRWAADAAASLWGAATPAGWAAAREPDAPAAAGNGLNGFSRYAEDSGWPQASESATADRLSHAELDLDEADLLPQRVRQASLAPQLREGLVQSTPTADGEIAAAAQVLDRSPEEARSTVTAIQRGWERGRSIFDASAKSTEARGDTESSADDTAADAGSPSTQAGEE